MLRALGGAIAGGFGATVLMLALVSGPSFVAERPNLAHQLQRQTLRTGIGVTIFAAIFAQGASSLAKQKGLSSGEELLLRSAKSGDLDMVVEAAGKISSEQGEVLW